MRVGSLFSGAGGLDLAVEQVFGATTTWHCEVDQAASKVLAHRWPGVPNLGDITQVHWDAFPFHIRWMEGGLKPDILCGGYPCQPFSAAGQRKGTNDERHLWPYFAEAIRRIRPRYVVLENVAGHRSMGFNSVLADLADMRYDAQWCSVRASDVGAPHRRERIFVIAHPTGGGRTRLDGRASGTPARTGWQRDLTGSNGCAAASDAAGDRRHEGRPEPARLLGRSDAAVSGDGPVNLLPTPTSSDCFGPGLHGDGGMDLRTTVTLLPTPQAHDGAGPKSPEQIAVQRLKGGVSNLNEVAAHNLTTWGKYEPAIRRWETHSRPAPPPTEPNTKNNPRLSAAFSEWMMGWPAGWVTNIPGISRNDALRIIGNGVVPQQAVAALTWLLSVSEAVA